VQLRQHLLLLGLLPGDAATSALTRASSSCTVFNVVCCEAATRRRSMSFCQSSLKLLEPSTWLMVLLLLCL
jgi:hypothetical protein